MYNQTISYGIYPDDLPKEKRELIWFWSDSGWDQCHAYELEEGERWAYEIPALKEKKTQIKELDRGKLLKILEDKGVDINATVE